MVALNNVDSLWYFLPEAVLVCTFVLILLLDLPKSLSEKRWLSPAVTAAGLVLYIAAAAYTRQFPEAIIFHGMMVSDAFTDFFRIFCALSTLFTVYLSVKSYEVSHVRSEYWALLVGITLGMPLLAGANNLLMIYLALELVSILSYILVGYLHGSRPSSEAALKYVLYGATASGIMIYGLSLIFGVSGTLDAIQIREFLLQNPAERLALFVGLLMALAGFGYKVSMVPFHMWAPDVYQGAPTPVTAFLSVGPKAAGFAILLRFIYTALTQRQEDVFVPLKYLDISTLMSVFAVATMTLGNFVAIQQSNVKRFLAYSSIAHAGYMLMATAALNTEALRGVIFYLISYLIMNMGAFAVAIAVINQFKTEELDAFKGLAKRSGAGALASLAMTLFMFSLTGLPPTVGFIGKFYLFSSVIQAKLYVLAVIGVLNSVVSLYYYARVVKYMYFDAPADDKPFTLAGLSYSGLLVGLAAATLFFGLFWNSLSALTEISAHLL
jgi:NADH-quinone oxidoreductase subunit N